MNNKFWLRPHLIALAFLGFNTGFAFILSGATLMMALSFSGFSTAFIGGLFLSSLPYSLKVLWSPLMDYYAIPVLSKMLGQRRSWLLLAQLGLFLSSLGFIIKTHNIWLLGAISTMFVFFAASQDIALDAYRIERLDPDELASGTIYSTTGFRVGILLGSTLPLYLLKTQGWSIAFTFASLCLLTGPIITLMVQEPAGVKRTTSHKLPSPVEHIRSVYKSFLEFLQRPDWYLIILFIFFYKVGDSIPNAMKGPLLASLDFTPIETANISQAYGTILTILGGLLGGILVSKLGIFRSIIVGGVAQLFSPFMYTWLTMIGHSIPALIATTTVQSIACGLGSTILIIYVSSLCKKGGTTATQYALIYSFSALTRTILSSASGLCATYMDWTTFFMCTTLMGLPVFLIIKKLTPMPVENRE